MRKKILSMEGLPESLFLPRDTGEPDRRYAAALQAVRRAVAEELTQRQRECLMRRFQGEAVKQIAAELGIQPPTVVKHIHAAQRRLSRIFRYSGFFSVP